MIKNKYNGCYDRLSLNYPRKRAAFIEVFWAKGRWEHHDCDLNRNTLFLYQCDFDWANSWFGTIPNKKVRVMTGEEVDLIFWQEIQLAKQRTNTNEGVAELADAKSAE